MKLITVENITISEFRTLLTSDSDIGTIKYDTSSLPIHIHASGGFGNKNYSTILISFSIEFTNGDKGFVMLSLPHDFCNIYLNNELLSVGSTKHP